MCGESKKHKSGGRQRERAAVREVKYILIRIQKRLNLHKGVKGWIFSEEAREAHHTTLENEHNIINS